MNDTEELFKSFDWEVAFYDPLHDIIEADTDQDKEDLQRMETLLHEWDGTTKIPKLHSNWPVPSGRGGLWKVIKMNL